MRLRFARVSDADALRAIYAPYVEHTTVSFEYAAPTIDEFRARVERISAEYPYIVCEENGGIVGYAYAHRAFERAAYGWDAELSVYVRRGDTGRGIGRALYGALIEILKLQNVVNVYGVVTGDNKPSDALHEAAGFSVCARFPRTGFKFGKWIDVVWYERRIAEGDPKPFVSIRAVGGDEVLKKYGV